MPPPNCHDPVTRKTRAGPWAARLVLLLVCGACVRGASALATATSPSAPTAMATATATVTATTADTHAGHDMAAHDGHMAGLPPASVPAGALFTEADIRFMQGMIAHHAQAIHMSRMAVSHGANLRLQRLAQKIDQSQAGEIVLMQEWLRANGQFAPDTSSWRTMTMMGMLTTADLAQLDASRGDAFDRRYLVSMIRHHEGALQMVTDLLATPRAAQDVDVSVFANDVETTQRAEIAQMRAMLLEL